MSKPREFLAWSVWPREFYAKPVQVAFEALACVCDDHRDVDPVAVFEGVIQLLDPHDRGTVFADCIKGAPVALQLAAVNVLHAAIHEKARQAEAMASPTEKASTEDWLWRFAGEAWLCDQGGFVIPDWQAVAKEIEATGGGNIPCDRLKEAAAALKRRMVKVEKRWTHLRNPSGDS